MFFYICSRCTYSISFNLRLRKTSGMNALLYLFTLYIFECVGLKDLKINVPIAVPSGSTLRMNCTYDLENTALYSIKWYLRDQEFYRYVPKESPPTRVFPMSGIEVDVEDSDENRVTIVNVQRDLTGYYKCEVSADAPLFHTGIKTKLTYVTDEPSSPPTLLSNKMKYSAGDVINVSCITRESYPAVNTSWFLNNQTAKNMKTVRINNFIEHRPAELVITKSYLMTKANPQLFPTGRIKIRCEISQFHLYKSWSEIELVDNAPPKLAQVIGPSLSPQSAGNCPKLQNWTAITFVLLLFIFHTKLL